MIAHINTGLDALLLKADRTQWTKPAYGLFNRLVVIRHKIANIIA